MSDLQLTGPTRPTDWHVTQRVYPHWRADARAFIVAAQQARSIAAKGKTHSVGDWRFVGPDRVDGRVSDIDYNWRSSDSIYVAAATGGVFLSPNGGTDWQPLFDDQPNLSIGDIAVDPIDASVVYVGTGEANGGHNNLPGAGIFKSIDGGTTWSQSGLEGSVSISRIQIDPLNTNRVFAAVAGSYFAPGAERGVYRSLDGGANWVQVMDPADDVGVIDLVIHPENPDTLYAATWQRVRSYEFIQLSGPGSGVYRSTDGGDTWEELDIRTALGPIFGGDIGRIGLAICESQPNVLYASVNDGFEPLGVLRTNDGGDTWFDADPSNQTRAAASDFSWYFGQIRVNPDNPDEAYFLDVRMARTTNGGQSWQLTGAELHVDHHALVFVRGTSRIYSGNDGGVGVSDDGARWTRLSGLPTTQFYAIDVDPQDSRHIIGGTQDNGTVQKNVDSQVWRLTLGGDGFAPIIHPTNPDIIYMQSQFGRLNKSLDGGRSSFPVWSNSRGIASGDPRNWSTPVAMDPSNPEVLYYGTNRVYRTDDGAGSWQAVSPVLPQVALSSPQLGTLTSIAVAPTDPTVIWAGTDDGRVWVTTDPKVEWIDVTGDLPRRWVTEVLPDPNNAAVAYVTFSGLKWRDPVSHVYRTEDLGITWTDVSSNLPDAPANAISVDPIDSDRIFVGTDLGAYVSEDRGETWQIVGSGMPMVAVYDLDAHEESRQLFAATHGRSIYSAQLPANKVSASAELPPTSIDLVEAWPNPFAARLHIRAKGEVRVVDVRGRTVTTLSVDGQGSWDGRLSNGQTAPPGLYLLHVDQAYTGASARQGSTTVVKLPDD